MPLYIFGGKSTALEIAETAETFLGDKFKKVVLVVPSSEPHDGEQRVCVDLLAEHIDRHAGGHYILSMSDQGLRRQCMRTAVESELIPTNIVHPQSSISPTAKLGKGIYVAAFAVISSGAMVDDHVVVNYQVVIGHDSEVNENVIVNPGAKIGGNARIGKRTLVGANSFVLQGQSVGEDVQIDAMTYVDRDIDDAMICSNRGMRVLKRPFFRLNE
jgi:acetyltransferase EpsM